MRLSPVNIKLRSVIKKLMRKNGFTYRDLAAVLKLSESSVKRIMNGGDLEVERVVRIADWLGYSVSVLFELASTDGDGRPLLLTEKQEAFLVANPKAAYLDLRLLLGESTREFAAAHGMSHGAVLRLLYGLERAGLVDVLSDDRAKIKFRGPYAWREGGEMVNAYLKRLTDTIYASLLSQAKLDRHPDADRPDGMIRPFETYLTAESLANFVAEIREVTLKYRKITNFEVATLDRRKLFPVSALFMVGKFNAWEAVFMKDAGKAIRHSAPKSR
jgi:transcriptional regulator with XRE-family HTH domain